MPRANLYAPLRFNLTGHDREAVRFEVGEQEIPAELAAWLRDNPACGAVLPDAEPEPTAHAESPQPRRRERGRGRGRKG